MIFLWVQGRGIEVILSVIALSAAVSYLVSVWTAKRCIDEMDRYVEDILKEMGQMLREMGKRD